MSLALRPSLRPLVAFAGGWLACGILCLSCTPEARKAAVPASERAACVLLRAALKDGTVDQVCATADELAPLVTEILALRTSPEVVAASTEAPPVAPVVVATMPAPTRKIVARRRCSSWVAVSSGKDAATDGP